MRKVREENLNLHCRSYSKVEEAEGFRWVVVEEQNLEHLEELELELLVLLPIACSIERRQHSHLEIISIDNK